MDWQFVEDLLVTCVGGPRLLALYIGIAKLIGRLK